MNIELEKLVDLALIDGYITDKEKQVLFKKAEKLGFDTDELEMILNGKLYEINQESLKKIPKVVKCPNCGEVMSGISKVCKSCNYVTDLNLNPGNETVDDSLNKLSLKVEVLRGIPKHSSGNISNQMFKTVFTGGLYLLYKCYIKKEIPFDRYGEIHKRYNFEIDKDTELLKNKYGNNSELNAIIDGYVADRDLIIRERRRLDLAAAFAYFLFYSIIAALIVYLIVKPKEPETINEKAERLTKEKRIGEARAAALLMNNDDERDNLLNTLEDLEIDSLAKAGNYTEALRKANMLEETIDERRQSKINEIIEIEVKELIKEKQFTIAKERIKITDYRAQSKLLSLIEVEENISK